MAQIVLVEAVGTQRGEAVERLHLFQETQRRMGELEAFYMTSSGNQGRPYCRCDRRRYCPTARALDLPEVPERPQEVWLPHLLPWGWC